MIIASLLNLAWKITALTYNENSLVYIYKYRYSITDTA